MSDVGRRFDGVAIERVAQDGAVEAEVVGTVHAQLVRASRDGSEGYELMPVDNLKQAEAGDGGLAMHKVD